MRTLDFLEGGQVQGEIVINSTFSGLLLQSPEWTEKFVAAVVSMPKLMLEHHGMFRGTHEASLVEAQGAVFWKTVGGGVPYDHLSQITTGTEALKNRQRAMKFSSEVFVPVDDCYAPRYFNDTIRQIIKPLEDLSNKTRLLMRETMMRVESLTATNAHRLLGFSFDTRKLATDQLPKMREQFEQRNTEASIIPSSRSLSDNSDIQKYIARIRQVPSNKTEATQKLAPVMKQMRTSAEFFLMRKNVSYRNDIAAVVEPLRDELVRAISPGGLFGF